MVKSIVLKKVVASILALATISTFSVVSCFAMDPDNQESPDFVITTTNKEKEYDEDYAREIMSPEINGDEDSADGSELDPDALVEEEEYDEEHAREIMSPETSEDSDSNEPSALDPDALI